MFVSFQEVKVEIFEKEIILFLESKLINFWKWSIVVLIVLFLGILSFMYFNNNSLFVEEEEVLMVFNQVKEIMLLFLENLNKGILKIGYIDEFSENIVIINLIN